VFDFAVVIPTVLRPSLLQACQSIVAQTVEGSINVVIGVDYPRGPLKLLDDVRHLERDNRKITIIHPGYSTSSARGGVFPNPFGGALRTICSFAANARHIAYLDDDNAFRPDHVAKLVAALDANPGAGFAYSQILMQGNGMSYVVGFPPPSYGQIDTSAIMHRREILDLAQWRDEGQPTIDWDITERWLQAGVQWAHVPEVTADYYFT